MEAPKFVSIRIETDLAESIQSLSASRHETKSETIRFLLREAISYETSKMSSDFIREQLGDELRQQMLPQFNRIAALQAKIGYQSISCFNLLSHIFDEILPDNKAKDFEEIKEASRRQAVEYLSGATRKEHLKNAVIDDAFAEEKMNKDLWNDDDKKSEQKGE